MSSSFEVTSVDPRTSARTGVLKTPHGVVRTPVFMPVGTAATVKALPGEELESLGARIILGNTYHLYLRPGSDTIRELGGLHRFMSWRGAILTDSGGYQVFSHRDLRSISEEGVRFRSHLDGGRHFLSPERAIEIQRDLGSDIVMAFDECTPFPVSQAEAADSMRRSMRWAERCKETRRGEQQALFGIVQGGMFLDLRLESLDRVTALDLDGTALGGFSVGEPKAVMYDLVSELGSRMPAEKPRYLMGVGTPLDLIHCIESGIDMFDCVLPTRNARNGTLFTWSGKVRIKNSRYRADGSSLDSECGCRVCSTYTKAYLRHLFVSKEILASILNTYHNVAFYLELLTRIRKAISTGALADLKAQLTAAYGPMESA